MFIHFLSQSFLLNHHQQQELCYPTPTGHLCQNSRAAKAGLRRLGLKSNSHCQLLRREEWITDLLFHGGQHIAIEYHCRRVLQCLILKLITTSLAPLHERDRAHDIFSRHRMMLSPSWRTCLIMHHHHQLELHAFSSCQQCQSRKRNVSLEGCDMVIVLILPISSTFCYISSLIWLMFLRKILP